MISYIRRHLPLCVAKATTIHKAQGQSLISAVVDSRYMFSRGMAYVAIGRAKFFDRLWVVGNHLSAKAFQHGGYSLIAAEYVRLRGLRASYQQ